MKRLSVIILLAISLSACLKDEPFKRSYAGLEPQQRADGIATSTLEAENIDRKKLELAYELLYSDERYLMARSLLVYRNGKLVAEAYPHNPKDIDAICNMQSATKSITSIATGIAIQEKQLGALTERLYSIYPEYFDSDMAKRTITIEDALTMQTGLEFDNDDQTQELYEAKGSSVQYVLAQKRLYESGTIMNYNDGAPQLVSKAIERKVGKPLSDYVSEKLFAPLGITEWKWEKAKDGTTFGAFSLFLKPRDIGKIGELLRQNGKWGDRVIISSAYLAEATSIKVSANFDNEPFGYYFWVFPSYKGYAAIGHGGQFLLVVPDKKLVAVYTAWPYTSGNFYDESSELIKLIINSCN
jgi:CubicO group peptidase (beta-lactamase class C family)